MMKRIVAFILVIAMLVSMTACGNSEEGNAPPENSATESQLLGNDEENSSNPTDSEMEKQEGSGPPSSEPVNENSSVESTNTTESSDEVKINFLTPLSRSLMLNEVNPLIINILEEAFPPSRYSQEASNLNRYALNIWKNGWPEMITTATDYLGFNDYYVAGFEYGPDGLFSCSVYYTDAVVYSISTSTSSPVVIDHISEIDSHAVMSLIPVLIMYENGDVQKQAEQLWAQMQIVDASTSGSYINMTYAYATDKIDISLTVSYRPYGSRYSLLIDAEANVSEKLVAQTKNSPEYLSLKQEYEDSIPTGTYQGWETSTEEERYFSTIYLLQDILNADGVFSNINVSHWGGTSSNRDIINYLVPVIVNIYDINLDTANGEISFYVTGARDDLIYRIYTGDVNNEDFEYWGYDWNGNQLVSSVEMSMSEYVRSVCSAQQQAEEAAKEEQESKMLDEAGVPLEFRFDYHADAPEVIVSGYMRNGTQFVLDQKIAFKGYWEADRWDVIEELYIATRYKLEYGKRYTLKGVLNYDALQGIEVIEESE